MDMISGENGVKGFEEGSAFGELTRILTRLGVIPPRLFTRFADHLNLTDSGKRCNDRIALPGLVLSWRYAGLDDMTIVSRAHEILSGMMTGMEENRTRVNKSRNLPIKDGIALNLTSGGHDRKTLARRGAYMVVVQHEGSGQSVILTSRGQRAGLDLNEVSNQLPDKWFIHPSGFLACYGSRKAPKAQQNRAYPSRACARSSGTGWYPRSVTCRRRSSEQDPQTGGSCLPEKGGRSEDSDPREPSSSRRGIERDSIPSWDRGVPLRDGRGRPLDTHRGC